jgi:hypothetical protein
MYVVQTALLTVNEQRALLWIAGVLFSGAVVTSWYVVRQLFGRLARIEADIRALELALASRGVRSRKRPRRSEEE